MTQDIDDDYIARNWGDIDYDHKKVRAALDRAFMKYPESERYERMVLTVQDMLDRAKKYGTRHAISFQKMCLNALLADRR